MRWLLFFWAMVCCTCCTQQPPKLVKLSGEAQGTTYNITYLATGAANYQKGIDSILKKIDTSMSTYLPVSMISRINQGQPGVQVDEHFKQVFKRSMEISAQTNGLFDATVGPLVRAWGFGPTRKQRLDAALLDSVHALVGYQKITLHGDTVVKAVPGIQLDFNAIAQGYTVDVLAAYLQANGIENYLVELGGEVRTKGAKPTGPWKVGIDKPANDTTGQRPMQAVVTLGNQALCTSGNYRKFYEEDGRRYAHIIDPISGQPARQNLLSATVVANDATTADAYATAFMIMGLARAKQFLLDNTHLGLQVFFVYDENGKWQTYTSPGLAAAVTLVEQ